MDEQELDIELENLEDLSEMDKKKRFEDSLEDINE